MKTKLNASDRSESLRNLMGQTRYIDDLGEAVGMLYALPVPSPSARGHKLVIDASAALALDRAIRVITAKDIPGENQLGSISNDESLLADGEWSFKGEVVALVLAPSKSLARRAVSLVHVSGENLTPVLDEREAFAQGNLIFSTRTIRTGDVEAVFKDAAFTASGRVDSGGQEHVYLETQAAIAYPEEGDRIRVISSTQSPTAVQRGVARVLGLAFNEVEVEANRLGGGFGGKEDQATTWAALAALGAVLSGKPVKLVLRRREDLRLTGKRHPYSSDFRIALDKEGMITAYEVDFYQNAGACTDLSPGILGRSLFHAAGAYKIDAVRASGSMCRTNLPPFTAFRGFGGPQAFFVIEAAIVAVSEASGIPVATIQRKNLLAEGDIFPYGQKADHCHAISTWDRLVETGKYQDLRASIGAFNKENHLVKRGVAIIPVAFGISFTKLSMNQAGALVHVFKDGSVAVNTGVVEMGQGVIRKILNIVEKELGLDSTENSGLVSIERTRTATVANTQATAASTGSDLNGMAALLACREIKERLSGFASKISGSAKWDWKKLVAEAHEARIDLSSHAHYATPGLFYDEETERGSPFAYHVYGTCLVEAELDVLRATYHIVQAKIVHDGGYSLDELTDRGQVEGAFAQGLGWSILEELLYGKDGSLLTDTLSTYKLPDAGFMDFPLELEFYPKEPNPEAVLGSKAVGEPPLMYGIAAYFAVMEALRAARKAPSFFNLPMTAEKALAFLEGEKA